VAANPRSKLIHKVMTLGKKVANERAFRERQRFGELLAGPSLEHSREQHPLADFRIAEVLHQSEVVKVSHSTRPRRSYAALRSTGCWVGGNETLRGAWNDPMNGAVSGRSVAAHRRLLQTRAALERTL
jgi:hypothetical protein